MESNWAEHVSGQGDGKFLPEDFNKIGELLEPEMHKHIDEITGSHTLSDEQKKALYSYIISHAEMAVYGVSAITAHEETGMFGGINLPKTLGDLKTRLKNTAHDVARALQEDSELEGFQFVTANAVDSFYDHLLEVAHKVVNERLALENAQSKGSGRSIL